MGLLKWLFGSTSSDRSKKNPLVQGDYYDDMKNNDAWKYYGIKYDQDHRR